MAVKINGTNNTIDMGGGSLVNNSNINGLIIPDESGSFITTQRADSHLPGLIPYNVYNGNVSLDNTITNAGFATSLYSGNGTSVLVNNGVDLSTQWGNDVSKKYGGAVLLKCRSAIGNMVIANTFGNTTYVNDITAAPSSIGARISSFNNTGFTVNASSNVNTNAATYVSHTFQTTHVISGTTNHGMTYSCAYNPYTGFIMYNFTGSGSVGHELPNYLGREIELFMIKNLSLANVNWVMETNTVTGLGTVLYPNLLNGMVSGTIQSFGGDRITLKLATNEMNAAGSNYVVYGWCNSRVDASNKLIGNYEIGTYVGSKYLPTSIKVKAKPAFMLIKRTDTTGSYYMVDNIRGTNKFTYLNLSDVETVGTSTVTFNNDNTISFNDNNVGLNADKGQYIYLIVYDNDNGSGKSTYTKTQDTTNINLNALVGYANGVDASGNKNYFINRSGVISGISLNVGPNYVYSKLDNTYGSSIVPPAYSVLDTRAANDFYNDKTNLWYNNIFALYNNCTSTTGWTLAPSSSMMSNGSAITFGNTSTVAGGIYTSCPTVIGKKYQVYVDLTPGSSTDPRINIATFAGGYDLVTNGYGGNSFFVATTTTTFFTIHTNSTVNGQTAIVNSLAVIPLDKLGNIDSSLATPVTSRNYLDCIVYADHNGKPTYVEDIPKKLQYNTTPALATYDTTLATTEYVRNVAGSFGRTGSLTGSYNLKPSDTGKFFRVNDRGSRTYVLPSAYLCPDGASFTFVCTADGALIKSGDGTYNNIYSNGGSVSSVPLNNGDFLTIVNQGSNHWYAYGSATMFNINNKNYEAGTWTPDVFGKNTAGSCSYAFREGNFLKIGGVVHCTCYVQISGHTGTGQIGIRGLPYNLQTWGSANLSYMDSLTYNGQVGAYGEKGTAYINLIVSNTNAVVAPLNIDAQFGCMIQFTYFV